MSGQVPREILTARLRLRPFTLDDAPAVLEIQSNWNVTRNLRLADWPPTLASISAFLASHDPEWRAGAAYRYAVTRDGRVIGCCDLAEIDGESCDIGYWYEEASWGGGIATEAAQALIDVARFTLGVIWMHTGHAADNPASGRVLEKLGFRHVDDVQRWSKPRRTNITQRRYRLDF